LSLLDPNGRVRALLHTTPDGAPSFELAGDTGHAAIHSSVGQDGRVELSLKDGNGAIAAQLAESAESGPYLGLADRDGVLRAKLGMRSWDSPFLDLADATGLVRASLGSLELQNPDSNEQVRRPASSLVLFDSDGAALWKTPLKPRR
jgi:hypothetical protein